MVSTTGTAVSVLPEWRFPNAGLRGHGGRNIHVAKSCRMVLVQMVIPPGQQGRNFWPGRAIISGQLLAG